LRQPGTVLRHLGGEYLLLEGGFDDDTRTLTVLARPDDPRFAGEQDVRPVEWCDQGRWLPVARDAVDEELLVQRPAFDAQRGFLEELLERYREERGELEPMAFTLVQEHGFAGSLEPFLPMGVAVPLFDDEHEAAAAAEERGAHVHGVHSVARFLTHLAREGYAGALWNRLLPVFACIDPEGGLHFLRVNRDGAHVALELLQADETWNAYDGAEPIEFLEDREACDARLVDAIGPVPLLDWPEDARLWSVGPSRDEPGIVALDSDELPYGLLFTSAEAASEWCEEADEPGWVHWPVPDLGLFLADGRLEGCGALLNPGAHRARSGLLWRDGARVVLDSFSGFWALDGERFEPVG